MKEGGSADGHDPCARTALLLALGSSTVMMLDRVNCAAFHIISTHFLDYKSHRSEKKSVTKEKKNIY